MVRAGSKPATPRPMGGYVFLYWPTPTCAWRSHDDGARRRARWVGTRRGGPWWWLSRAPADA